MVAGLDDLRWLSQRLKGVVDLIPELEVITSLEDKTAELQKQIPEFQAKADAAAGALKKAQNDYVDLQASVDIRLREVEAKADEIVKAAEDRASGIRSQAINEATKLRHEAEDYVTAQKILADDELTRLESYKAEVGIQEQRLINITNKINDLKASL